MVPRKARQSLAERLREVSPTLFENLVYDLLVRKGFKNPVWRTPGADGGRDIEGDFAQTDFSGTIRLERWYVQCKRYSTSIDWPRLHASLAYAINHDADYLLVCTTTTLSPRCRDEVSKHDSRRQRPFVRLWEKTDLDRLLAHDTLLLSKYGLAEVSPGQKRDPTELLWLVSKAAQAAYGYSDLPGGNRSVAEFAAAIAELATAVAVESLNVATQTVRPDRDVYDWARIDMRPGFVGWSPTVLRPLLATIRFMTREASLTITPVFVDNLEVGISITPLGQLPMSPTFEAALNTIALVGNVEWSVNGATIELRPRPTLE